MTFLSNKFRKGLTWLISAAYAYLLIQFVALILLIIAGVFSVIAFFPILLGIGVYLTTGMWQLSIIVAAVVLFPLSLLSVRGQADSIIKAWKEIRFKQSKDTEELEIIEIKEK